MPELESLPGAVLASLGFALFEPEENGVLRLAGDAPEWLTGIWPALKGPGSQISIGEMSPFLENFLIDAGECWREGCGRLQSGPWVQQDSRNSDVQLEATALTISGKRVLLVERLGEAFEAKKSVLQKARENVIAYQRLNTEMQKKEVLLHCVAEDMSAAVGNVVTALWLLELEHDAAKTRHFLNLASLATQEQRNLISRVLGMFADDLSGLYGRKGETPAEADLGVVTAGAVESTAAHFKEKGVRLIYQQGRADGLGKLNLLAHPDHLERVVTNLLENALQHTPPGEQVEVRIAEEPATVLLKVEDTGPPLPPVVTERLFAKFDASSTRSPASMLRLHFCRIAVENCNGDIGYEPRAGGGNCFWIRLPKIRNRR